MWVNVTCIGMGLKWIVYIMILEEALPEKLIEDALTNNEEEGNVCMAGMLGCIYMRPCLV